MEENHYYSPFLFLPVAAIKIPEFKRMNKMFLDIVTMSFQSTDKSASNLAKLILDFTLLVSLNI